MKNREIEEQLKIAVEHAKPDVLEQVLQRVESETEGVIPMDPEPKKRRRFNAAFYLSLAAAVLLVVNVFLLLHMTGLRQENPREAVEKSAGVSEGGALLIDQIVKLNPSYTPEELSAYSITELDTILSNESHGQVSNVTASVPAEEQVQESALDESVAAAQTAETSGNEEESANMLVSENAGGTEETDSIETETVSANESGSVSTGQAVQPTAAEEDPQGAQRPADTGNTSVWTLMIMNEEQAVNAVIWDAKLKASETEVLQISSILHTSYGMVYTVELQAGEYRYLYRITENGTILKEEKNRIDEESKPEEQNKIPEQKNKTEEEKVKITE